MSDRHYQVETEIAPPTADLQLAAIDRFLEVRNREGGLVKKPGTSEFLDWLKALQIFGETPYDPVKLQQEKDRLPYPELLLKVQKDWRQFTPVV